MDYPKWSSNILTSRQWQMALEMDGIIEYDVINLVMWVVALSLKGGCLQHGSPFSKRKAKIVVVFTSKKIVWLVVFYVFPSTNIVIVLTSKFCGRRTTHTGYTARCFSSTCFLVPNCPWFCSFAWLNKFVF